MKNIKKIIGIILTICMVLQILPVFANETQTSEAEFNYIINDNFSAESFDGWSLVKDTGYSSLADDLVSLIPVEGEEGNYALNYTSVDSKTARYTHITRTFGESVAISGDNDIVIETRMKTTGTNRAFLKYNLVTYPKFENEWNYNWGTLVGTDGSDVFVLNGWKANETTLLYGYPTEVKTSVSDFADKWHNYKIVIKGGEVDTSTHTAVGNTMDIIVTDDDGTIVKESYGLSMDFPNASSWENVNDKGNANITDYNWVEDALNTLDFRLRDAETLTVDYVRVYQQFDADMSVDEFILNNEDVVINIDIVKGDALFENSFALYDAYGDIVDTLNSIDETNKVVTLSPIDSLTVGEKYTVKLNKSVVPGNYNFVEDEVSFIASDVKYILYDEFGQDDLNGWELVKDSGKTTSSTTVLTSQEIPEEAGNYALEYISAATPEANWRYNHITRKLSSSVPFASDKELVIETRMKSTGTGRVYLKYNLETYPSIVNEWNYWWGALVGSDTDRFYIPNGWEPKNDVYLSNPVNTAWDEDEVLTGTGNKWYTYKFVIHGGEINNETHTATGNTMDVTITDNDGAVVTALKNMSMDFPDNSTWSHSGSVNAENVNWVEDALNSLDFRLRAQETLTVDYIKVYEQISADMSVDAFITPNEEIKVTVDIENGNSVLKDAFILYDENDNVIETSNTIDSTNKIVTIVPDDNLTMGKEYTVKLDTTKVPSNYVFATTEKTFKVSDIKYIMYDEFANNDFDGWEAKVFSSKSSSNTLSTEPYEENSDNYVLKYSSADATNSYYGYLSKSINPVTFPTEKDLVIETKVKDTKGSAGKGRFFIKYNLDGTAYSANEWQHSWGEFICVDEGLVYVNNGWKVLASGLNGTNLKSTGLSVAGDWHTYKIVIHGGETKDEAKADYIIYNSNGVEVARHEGITLDFPDNSDWPNVGTDTGSTGANWVEGVLNSVDFRLRNANELYIDYVKVYEKKDASVLVDCKDILGNAEINAYIKTGTGAIANPEKYVALYNGTTKVDANITCEEGTNKITIDPTEKLEIGKYTVKFDVQGILNAGYTIDGPSEFDVNVISSTNVNETFEDITTADLSDNGWYFRNDGLTNVTRNAEIVTEDGNKFLRISVDGDLELLEGKLVAYSKDLTNAKFVRDMENSTVMELKLRTNLNTVRKYFKYNYPTTGNISTNAYNEHGWNTRLGAVMDAGNIAITYGDYSYNESGRMQGKTENIASYETNKWYTVKTVFDNAQGKATSYIYDEEGVLVGSAEDKALSAWWFNYYDYDKTTPLVMHTIEDLTFQFRPESLNVTVVNEQFDVDDIKLYNMKVCDESVNAVFKSNDEVVDVIGREVTSIVPEFTIQTENDQTKDYYIIAAVYEKDKLLTSQFVPVTINGNDTITLDAITVDPQNTDIEVRAYIWDKNFAPVLSTPTIIKPLVCEVYLATDGNDLNTGEATSPVATLNRAIEIVNDAPDEGYITSKIIVKDGNYELTGETIEIGSNVKTDSLVIQAENEAKFVNGVVFNISDAIGAPETIKARLVNQDVKDNLYMIDLTTKVDLEDIPGVSLPGPYSYSANGLNTPNGEFVIDESRIATCEMFFDNKPMTLARYPDSEYEVLEEGKFSYDANSRTRYWMDDVIGTDDYIALDDRVTDGFTLTLDRAKNWGNADQALMFGYWYYDWATQTVPVASIDTTNGVITSKYPSHYGLYKTQRYYVYNLLEEITQPNEYFIDRTTGILYFYKSPDAQPDDEIIMSLYENKIFDIRASNVTIDGLTFTASRDAAIYSKGNNVVIKNCEISNTAGVAVELDGTNSVLEYCNIHDVNGGIKLYGGNLNTLTPGNNKVLNNTITNFSRLSKTYTDAIEVTGVGNKASHNKISDGEHLAMRFSGVDNEISYNEIFNVLKETDEAGAIYAGRSWTSRDNVVKYNYFHDLISTEETTMPICGIMLDDHFSGVEIFGNIFSNVAGYGIKGTGRDLVISNNIFEKCTSGAVRLTDASGNASSYSTHIKNIAKYYGNDVWFERFGTELFTEDGTSYNPDLVNSANVVYTNNFATDVASGADFGPVTEASGAKEPNKTFAVTNPLNGNYENNGAVITPYLEGFINIPFEQIGINGTAGR